MRHQFAVLFLIVVTVPIFTVSSKASSNGSLQIARANDYFGYKLLGHLEENNLFEEDVESENLFISPFSVSTVLTMVMAGAKGDTFEEIKNTLGVQLKLTEPQRYTAFNTLLRQLNNLSSSDTVNSLKLANAIALQTGETPLLPRYQRIVKRRLKAKIFSVNFEKEPEQAAELINQWASRKTKGKIRKLVEGTLDPGTRVVLLNALYFNGTWASPFRRDDTENEEFTYGEVERRKKITVPMMKKSFHRLNYLSSEEGELVELPYRGHLLSMLLFLPAVGDPPPISFTFLDFRKRHNGYSKMTARKVTLSLPRFKIESSLELKPTLREMGIEAAFEDAADFSRMTGNGGDGGERLKLSQVLHKAVVEVNEEGSEAAAATMSQAVARSWDPRKPIKLNFNRPFLFAIRCKPLQLTLFAGIVNKPQEVD